MTAIVTFTATVTGVGQCVATALDGSLGGRPVGFQTCLLVPSQVIPFDNCACGGRLAQSILSVYGSDKFPTAADQAGTWTHCGPRFQVAQVMLQVTRCVPSMSDQGVPPACGPLLNSAAVLESDRATVRQALYCCLFALYQLSKSGQPGGIANFSIGASQLVGDLGGCAAIETPYLVGLPSCNCGGT